MLSRQALLPLGRPSPRRSRPLASIPPLRQGGVFASQPPLHRRAKVVHFSMNRILVLHLVALGVLLCVLLVGEEVFEQRTFVGCKKPRLFCRSRKRFLLLLARFVAATVPVVFVERGRYRARSGDGARVRHFPLEERLARLSRTAQESSKTPFASLALRPPQARQIAARVSESLRTMLPKRNPVAPAALCDFSRCARRRRRFSVATHAQSQWSECAPYAKILRN